MYLFSAITFDPGALGTFNWIAAVVGILIMLFGNKLPPALVAWLKSLVPGMSGGSAGGMPSRNARWENYCAMITWGEAIQDDDVIAALNETILPKLHIDPKVTP